MIRNCLSVFAPRRPWHCLHTAHHFPIKVSLFSCSPSEQRLRRRRRKIENIFYCSMNIFRRAWRRTMHLILAPCIGANIYILFLILFFGCWRSDQKFRSFALLLNCVCLPCALIKSYWVCRVCRSSLAPPVRCSSHIFVCFSISGFGKFRRLACIGECVCVCVSG